MWRLPAGHCHKVQESSGLGRQYSYSSKATFAHQHTLHNYVSATTCRPLSKPDSAGINGANRSIIMLISRVLRQSTYASAVPPTAHLESCPCMRPATHDRMRVSQAMDSRASAQSDRASESWPCCLWQVAMTLTTRPNLHLSRLVRYLNLPCFS